MSHFTKVRTRLTDRAVLEGALQRMGYAVEPPGRGIKGWMGQRTDAAFKIKPTPKSYEIGFIPSSSGFTIVADWYGVEGVSEAALLVQLTQQYAVEATMRTLEARGFELDTQVNDDDGMVRLKLRRSIGSPDV